MTLDQELIRNRCQEIMDSLARLEQIGREAPDVFLKDQDMQDIGSYRLLVAIEAALGLCYHIAAKRLLKIPDDYAQCFAILEKAGLIEPDLSTNLQKMARFRNLLVHMYWKVDYVEVHKIIREYLNDLRAFSGIAAALI